MRGCIGEVARNLSVLRSPSSARQARGAVHSLGVLKIPAGHQRDDGPSARPKATQSVRPSESLAGQNSMYIEGAWSR